ncbi:DUF4350 domain-containing protein [Flavobacterium ardleyense]|uniref:DUF4350 domain-containing protein n=1 Tax=Flavobacterium ardleyense TaxID=2038737 RepID=A0ABW5Z7F4_9FLAO
MPKSLKIYLFLLVLIFVGIIWADATKDKPIDWRETYSIKDKIPFGMYVFDQEFKQAFDTQIVEKFSETPYEYFDAKYSSEDSTYTINGTALFIDKSYAIDEYSEKELFYFASYGNDVFLSTSNLSQSMADSLGFEIGYHNNFIDSLQFKTEGYDKPDNFYFKKGINNAYFSKIDSTTTWVLGTQIDTKGKEVTNFIRAPYKGGFFYLHLQPVVFTNYYMLDKNIKYAENVLEYIPEETNIYWNVKQREGISSSPMRYLLTQPALKWAWFLAWITFIIFMFFNAKRRQRVIPIIEPLKNTTVDFTKTIGNLYYQEKNHQNIAEKKVVFFLEKIRNEYYIDTFNLDETFCNRLQQKTGNQKKDIEEVVYQIKRIRNQGQTTEQELITFNNLLEKLNL